MGLNTKIANLVASLQQANEEAEHLHTAMMSLNDAVGQWGFSGTATGGGDTAAQGNDRTVNVGAFSSGMANLAGILDVGFRSTSRSSEEGSREVVSAIERLAERLAAILAQYPPTGGTTRGYTSGFWRQMGL